MTSHHPTEPTPPTSSPSPFEASGTATDPSSAGETFQIGPEGAETYEASFVPAIFAEWAPHTLDAAGVEPGHRLLDVACGTGIVARTAQSRLGSDLDVTGVDLNPAMLTVAQRVGPAVTWRQGDVIDLPFPDASFDAVTCQMAAMFFPDPVAAFAEMARVLRPGGRLGLVVPATLEAQPAYRPFVEVAVEHAGPDARSLLTTYFASGDRPELVERLISAGLRVPDPRTRTGTARFASPADLVATEVRGSPLVDRIDDATYRRIEAEVAHRLARYVTDDGFEIPLVSHVVGARRPV